MMLNIFQQWISQQDYGSCSHRNSTHSHFQYPFGEILFSKTVYVVLVPMCFTGKHITLLIEQSWTLQLLDSCGPHGSIAASSAQSCATLPSERQQEGGEGKDPSNSGGSEG